MIPSLQEQNSISVSDSATTTNLAWGSRVVVIKNSGSKTAYVAFNGVTATTSMFPIEAGDVITLDDVTIHSMSSICAATETTTLKVLMFK